MKITNQIIAAASFSALLFAPLAQAQVGSDSDTQSITLEVISAGVSITATEMSFGTVTPNAADVERVLELTCDGGTSTTTFTNSTGTFGGSPKCGIVTVTSESSQTQNYQLTVQAPALTNLTNNAVSINPTLTVFGQNGSSSVAGIASDGITAPGSDTSDSISIATSESDTYMLGGKVTIAANQETGTYSGDYTVTATVI